jgi:2'-5' RNA ligase
VDQSRHAGNEPITGQPVYRRLFIAIWPNETLRSRLHEAARRCLADGRGRLVAQDNLHVTLAFLGAVDEARQACCEQVASRVASPGFSLTVDRLGYWPRKQILWAGCSSEPPELGALVSGLQAGLGDCGFADRTEARAARQGWRGRGFADRTEARAARQGWRGRGFADRTEARAARQGWRGRGFDPETRPFHVHVTLARHVRRDPFPEPRRSRHEHTVPIPPLEWPVDEFLLVESDTRPDGARYTVRRSWPLR